MLAAGRSLQHLRAVAPARDQLRVHLRRLGHVARGVGRGQGLHLAQAQRAALAEASGEECAVFADVERVVVARADADGLQSREGGGRLSVTVLR